MQKLPHGFLGNLDKELVMKFPEFCGTLEDNPALYFKCQCFNGISNLALSVFDHGIHSFLNLSCSSL